MDNFYKELNRRFGIETPTKLDQDWTFTFGKPEQTAAYIDFYHEFAGSMSDDQKDAMINMIIQGYEDILSMSSGKTDETNEMLWDRIESILKQDNEILSPTIKYWASLQTSLEDAWHVSGKMRKLVKAFGLEWNTILSDEDIEYLNNIYDDFEDSLIVSMNYISGDSVDESLTGTMNQDNDLRIRFQRLDENPFSIELWFMHTRQIRFLFTNPSDQCLSDIMEAKVCRNESSVFWTTWKAFDPGNEKHLSLPDVTFVEAEGLKWRFVTE